MNKTKTSFNSGKSATAPAKLSRFEVLALGIPEKDWVSNEKLKVFAKQFKDVYYVPENLLKAWKITTIYDEPGKKGMEQ